MLLDCMLPLILAPRFLVTQAEAEVAAALAEPPSANEIDYDYD
jgi:hypothetical protein